MIELIVAMIELITAHPILTAAAVLIAFAVAGSWHVHTTPPQSETEEARRAAAAAARQRWEAERARQSQRDGLPGL